MSANYTKCFASTKHHRETERHIKSGELQRPQFNERATKCNQAVKDRMHTSELEKNGRWGDVRTIISAHMTPRETDRDKSIDHFIL